MFIVEPFLSFVTGVLFVSIVVMVYSGMLCACLDRGEAAARWLEGGPPARALEIYAARGEWGRAADLAATTCPSRVPYTALHQAQHLELT